MDQTGSVTGTREAGMAGFWLPLCLLQGLCLALAQPARGADRHVLRGVSEGACMVICEDIGFCRAMNYDRHRGLCTLFPDQSAAAYLQLRDRCAGGWRVRYMGARWRVQCRASVPSGPVPSAPPPSPGMSSGLEDVN